MKLKCAHCGYRWTPSDPDDIDKTLKAMIVNASGPFCGLCRTLEEAARFAQARRLLVASKLRLLRMALRKS